MTSACACVCLRPLRARTAQAQGKAEQARPAHALGQAVAVGGRDPGDEQQLPEVGLLLDDGLPKGGLLVPDRADLALLAADARQLRVDLLRHLVLRPPQSLSICVARHEATVISPC